MATGIKQYRATLNAAGTAGDRFTQTVRGRMVYIRQVSPVRQIRVVMRSVELGSKSGESVEVLLTQNDKIVLSGEFDRLEIYNIDSDVSVFVDVLVGDGDFERPLPDIVNVTVSAPTPARWTVHADKTVNFNLPPELLAPSNAKRVYAIVTNLDSSDGPVRIGSEDIHGNNQTSHDQGFPLHPGDSLKLETTGAIYGVAQENGHVCTVSTIEVSLP